jgi:hypothetical protein
LAQAVACDDFNSDSYLLRHESGINGGLGFHPSGADTKYLSKPSARRSHILDLPYSYADSDARSR